MLPACKTRPMHGVHWTFCCSREAFPVAANHWCDEVTDMWIGCWAWAMTRSANTVPVSVGDIAPSIYEQRCLGSSIGKRQRPAEGQTCQAMHASSQRILTCQVNLVAMGSCLLTAFRQHGSLLSRKTPVQAQTQLPDDGRGMYSLQSVRLLRAQCVVRARSQAITIA